MMVLMVNQHFLLKVTWYFAIALALEASVAHARDLNGASRADIESVSGVGVELADRLLSQRDQAPFTDWDDLRRRVKGLGKRNLRGFAEAGMRINEQLPPAFDGSK